MNLNNNTSNDDINPNMFDRDTRKALYCITFGYPIEPDNEKKNNYMQFFMLLCDVLPCKLYRDHCRAIILNDNSKFKINSDAFANRDSLTKWLYLVFEEFNRMLNINYGVTYEYVVKKYESYRAKCDVKVNPNNGLITKIWGPAMWIMFHSVCYGYPKNPSDNDKKQYRKFFELVGQVLPCIYCRESYMKFIRVGNSELNDDVVKCRNNLTLWMYLLHDTVNAKLTVNYGVTYENVNNKYESARVVTDDNAQYLDEYQTCKECPVIPLSISDSFVQYAQIRQKELPQILTDDDYKYINKIKQGQKITYTNASCDFWCKRNVECNRIIKTMRIYGMNSIETEGKWAGFPTAIELRLILRLASNLDNDVLADIVYRMTHFFKTQGISNEKKIYKLVCLKQYVKSAKGCLMPASNKINSYKYSYISECPIIDINLCKKFMAYARARSLDKSDYNFIANYEMCVKSGEKNCTQDLLIKRNEECDDIINYMRFHHIPSIEVDGVWKGLPTISELRLIIRMTTNLSACKLEKIAKELPKNY